MLGSKDIVAFIVDTPDGETIFGSYEEFGALSLEHKDQIFFLSSKASDILQNYIESQSLITGPLWDPFAQGHFQETSETELPTDEKALKKWLFECKIPFKNWVFVLPNYSTNPVYLTWKMIVKYCSELFASDDLVIFDQSANWCLFYFHEGHLFFGRHDQYESEAGYKKMEGLYDLRKKYPKFNHPLLPKKNN